LVVDDEVALAELTAEILMSAGHQVDIVHNASSALDAIKSKKFDVMISDVIMPGLNGFELAERVKKHNPEIKIIIVSGYNNQLNSTKKNKQLYDLNLEKPVTGAQLLHSVNSVLK